MLNTHIQLRTSPVPKIPYNKRNIQKRKLHIHLKEICTLIHMYLLNIEHKRREIYMKKKRMLCPLAIIMYRGKFNEHLPMNVETPKKQQKMYNKGGRMNKKKKKTINIFQKKKKKSMFHVVDIESIKNHTKERKNTQTDRRKTTKNFRSPFFRCVLLQQSKKFPNAIIFFCRCLKKTQTSIATVQKHIFIISQSPRSEINKVHIVCWKSDQIVESRP